MEATFFFFNVFLQVKRFHMPQFPFHLSQGATCGCSFMTCRSCRRGALLRSLWVLLWQLNLPSTIRMWQQAWMRSSGTTPPSISLSLRHIVNVGMGIDACIWWICSLQASGCQLPSSKCNSKPRRMTFIQAAKRTYWLSLVTTGHWTLCFSFSPAINEVKGIYRNYTSIA